MIEGAKITAIEAGADVAEGDGTSVLERMLDAKGSRRRRAMPIAHEQISVVIDGRSSVEAYTNADCRLILVIRHRHVGTSSNTRTFNASCDTPIALLLPAGHA